MPPKGVEFSTISDSESFAVRADFEYYIEDRSSGIIFYLILAGFLTLLASIFLALDNDALLLFSLACIPAILCIIYGFSVPKKIFTFDRLNDSITLSKKLFMKPITIPFSKGHALKAYYTATDGIIETALMFVPKKGKGVIGGTLANNNLEEYWAFTVWYMDKNRPLPPGTAFDPYRQKDFERRKAEGFPKPLYPSNIPTPEATKKQQAERRRIGGW